MREALARAWRRYPIVLRSWRRRRCCRRIHPPRRTEETSTNRREFRRAHIRAVVSSSPACPPERLLRGRPDASTSAKASGRTTVAHSTVNRPPQTLPELLVPMPVMQGRAQMPRRALAQHLLQTSDLLQIAYLEQISDHNNSATSPNGRFVPLWSRVRLQSHPFHRLSFMERI